MNKSHKKLSAISASENNKNAAVEAELKKTKIRTYFVSSNCKLFSENCLKLCLMIYSFGLINLTNFTTHV